MASTFAYRRVVEFADTDTANVVHFTALFRYIEEAEHAFYRSLGVTAFEWRPDLVVGMPRVAVSCDFLAPVRFGEEITVHLTVREKREKALRYEAEITRDDPDGPCTVARGAMTVVWAVRRHGERDWSGAPLPAELVAQIEAEPAPPEA